MTYDEAMEHLRITPHPKDCAVCEQIERQMQEAQDLASESLIDELLEKEFSNGN